MEYQSSVTFSSLPHGGGRVLRLSLDILNSLYVSVIPVFRDIFNKFFLEEFPT